MNLQIRKVTAVMDRRILVNYRVRPEALATLLPAPFIPKVLHGWSLGGICLIRLERMRPAFLPAFLGVASENAAHRFAIEWTESGTVREGVFIPRRDTDSWLNRIAGGRLFPGVHHPARFESEEHDGRFHVALNSLDGETVVRVTASRADAWPSGSVFGSLDEASTFFQGGCRGWSPGTHGDLEGVELRVDRWAMSPLAVDHVASSFFGDTRRFPPGTIEFDSALLMHGIPHSWRALDRESLACRRGGGHRHGPSALFDLP